MAVDVPRDLVDALAGGRHLRTVLPVDLDLAAGDVLDALAVVDLDAAEAVPVVLVHDDSRPATVAAARVRALAPPGTVLPVPVALPPLARACAASLLADLAARVPAATLVAAVAREAVASLHVAARLGSVTNLDRPAPSMAQHLRSHVPGSSFLVTLQPRRGVAVWDGAALAAVPAPGPDALLVTTTSRDARFAAGLRSRLATGAVLEVPWHPCSADWWGTRHVAEAVAVPVAALDHLASAPAFGCRWCRRPMRGPTCPACRMHHDDEAARPA